MRLSGAVLGGVLTCNCRGPKAEDMQLKATVSEGNVPMQGSQPCRGHNKQASLAYMADAERQRLSAMRTLRLQSPEAGGLSSVALKEPRQML